MGLYSGSDEASLPEVIGGLVVAVVIIFMCHCITAAQNPGKELKATGFTSGGDVIYTWVDKDKK